RHFFLRARLDVNFRHLRTTKGHQFDDEETLMSRAVLPCGPRVLKRWCLYVLVLLAPGSFVILPVVWCMRRLWEADGEDSSYENKLQSFGRAVGDGLLVWRRR